SGTQVRYRIDANPTKRLGNSAGDKKGRLAALHGADAAEWWHRRAAESGLELLSATASAMPDILGSRNRDRRGRCRATSHGVTRFEGVAGVADPEKVRSAVVEGIGRALTYGCGLLSIVPVPTSGGRAPVTRGDDHPRRLLTAPTVAMLPRVADSLSFLYLENVRFVQDDTGVCAYVEQPDGGTSRVYLPVAAISCILFGTGT